MHQQLMWKRNPGLPVQRQPKSGDVHDIMTPELRTWLARRKPSDAAE